MPEDLQFDKAEYTGQATASSCTHCHQELGAQYYELNGNALCGRCRSRIQRERQEGSRAGRALAATSLGLVAAAVGTAIWYGVRALTGYEFGLLAILVGLGVGMAVRVGSKGRGGWAYQALAVLLTYASIVSTYVPDIVQAIRDQPGLEAAAADEEGSEATAEPSDGSAVLADAALESPPGEPEAATVGQMGLGQGLLALSLAAVVLMAIAFVAPFLGGAENIMGIIIIGIALYEAWKINKKVPLAITGPYRLADSGRAPTSGV